MCAGVEEPGAPKNCLNCNVQAQTNDLARPSFKICQIAIAQHGVTNITEHALTAVPIEVVEDVL